MKRMIVNWITTLVLFTLLVACGSSTSTETHFIKQMNIEDADTLVVGEHADDDESRLYKFTSEGVLEVVEYRDEDGKLLTQVRPPSAIYNVNDTYVLLDFSGTVLLTRKTDGAAFLVDQAYLSELYRGFNARFNVQSDDDDGIYFVDQTGILDEQGLSTGLVQRINTKDPNNLTLETLTLDIHFVKHLVVRQNGSLVYQYGNLSDDVSFDDQFLVWRDQQLDPLADVDTFWKGTNGDVYALLTDNNIVRVVDDENNNTLLEPYASLPPTENLFFFQNGFDTPLLHFPEHTVLILEADNRVFELENPDKEPMEIETGIATFTHIATTKRNYFIAGRDAQGRANIVSINPVANTVDPVLTAGEFQITEMDIFANNKVLFHAVRLSDSSSIVAEIGENNAVTILSEEPFAGEISVLRRIR